MSAYIRTTLICIGKQEKKEPCTTLCISFIQSAKNMHGFKVNSDKKGILLAAPRGPGGILEQTHNYIHQKAKADCDCFIL